MAIQKYNPPALVKSARVESALERLRQEQSVTRQEPVTVVRPSAIDVIDIDVIDLWRICAISGKIYISRYVRKGKKWQHAQSFRHEEGFNAVRYRSDIRGSLMNADIQSEKCAWCSAIGLGAVHCHACDRFVCYGKTTGSRFKCCCGSSGEMAPANLANNGSIPS